MNTTLISIEEPHGLASGMAGAPAVFLPNAKATERFFEFFTVNIRNDNTRRAYYRTACRFSE